MPIKKFLSYLHFLLITYLQAHYLQSKINLFAKILCYFASIIMRTGKDPDLWLMDPVRDAKKHADPDPNTAYIGTVNVSQYSWFDWIFHQPHRPVFFIERISLVFSEIANTCICVSKVVLRSITFYISGSLIRLSIFPAPDSLFHVRKIT
jgi:hypothetical protein